MTKARQKRLADDFKHEAPHKQNGHTRSTTPAPMPWGDPILLGEVAVVPPFPLECLPGWLRCWVRAEAEATQTPPDLAAMLALAVAGAGLATKYIVVARDGWIEPTNIFVVVALPPGERKSTVFSSAIAPVLEHEAAELQRAAGEIAEAESAHRILEKRLKDAEAQAAKANDMMKRKDLERRAKDAAGELARHVVPSPPQLICDDVTPENLSALLAMHGGRMFLAAAEGTAFEIAKGRYSETANFDVFLKGHGGDALRVNRVSRGREAVDKPALSIALAVQPDVLRGLADNTSMRGRGFLARWLYSSPVSLVGGRKIAPAPVKAYLTREYREGVLKLWRSTGQVDTNGRPAPRELRFSKEADQAMQELETELEPRMKDGEDLSFLCGWAPKLAGAIVRLAGVLHVVQAIEDGTNWEAPISTATVGTAIQLGKEYLLPHALATFGVMAADARMETARAVWETIVKRVTGSAHSAHSADGSATKTVTRRDLFNWNRRRFPGGVKDIDPIVELLEKYALIRPQPQSGHPGRGHSSPVFEINPAALEACLEP